MPASTSLPPANPHSDAVLARYGARVVVEKQQEIAIRHRDHLLALEHRLEKAEEILAKAQEMDATKLVAAVAAGREGKAASSEKAERVIAETKRLIPIAIAAKQMARSDLHIAEDDFAMADNTVMVRVKERLLPTAEAWLAEAWECKRRLAILERALGEVVADDSRQAPKFHDELKARTAAKQRDAPIAALKIEVERLRFSGDHHEAALEIAHTVRKTMDDMRVSSVSQLPKVI